MKYLAPVQTMGTFVQTDLRNVLEIPMPYFAPSCKLRHKFHPNSRFHATASLPSSRYAVGTPPPVLPSPVLGGDDCRRRRRRQRSRRRNKQRGAAHVEGEDDDVIPPFSGAAPVAADPCDNGSEWRKQSQE